ncbi:hypothetical protein JTE90_020253 [Oedothorax gibbosus]|uniref:Uncharacterized protein n=1 Tax=Oedothorax gibbosus TaxID=931172 RepID=A0AAV6U0X1_9ARAC|nr:hypothetical protein JTE90_020253 [Oedothorax gibbosus]
MRQPSEDLLASINYEVTNVRMIMGRTAPAYSCHLFATEQIPMSPIDRAAPAASNGRDTRRHLLANTCDDDETTQQGRRVG